MLRMTLKPFKYLLIKHDEKKWFDLILPAILAALISCAYYFLEKPFAIVATGGLIPQINSLLQMLIGFYIASLAAISTFGNENIDELMAGNPPTLKMKEKGEWQEIPLTRRRFLCYLFGYLALMSIILYLAGVIATLFGYSAADILKSLNDIGKMMILKSFLLFVYLFFLINLVLTTLLGLYYLSIRIHEGS
ncbi:TPA: hypothetical protein PER13_001713 [Enterobacter hormaechei]|nr:hypothetical protein [Enterobacter hormaechei]